jgi:hypothetical protein
MISLAKRVKQLVPRGSSAIVDVANMHSTYVSKDMKPILFGTSKTFNYLSGNEIKPRYSNSMIVLKYPIMERGKTRRKFFSDQFQKYVNVTTKSRTSKEFHAKKKCSIRTGEKTSKTSHSMCELDDNILLITSLLSGMKVITKDGILNRKFLSEDILVSDNEKYYLDKLASVSSIDILKFEGGEWILKSSL